MTTFIHNEYKYCITEAKPLYFTRSVWLGIFDHRLSLNQIHKDFVEERQGGSKTFVPKERSLHQLIISSKQLPLSLNWENSAGDKFYATITRTRN